MVSNFTVILIIEAIFIIVRSQIEDTLNNFLVSPCLASVRPSSRPAWRRVREGLTGPVLCLTLPEIKTSALLPHTQSPATVQLTVKQDYESQHLLLHWDWVLGDQRQDWLIQCKVGLWFYFDWRCLINATFHWSVPLDISCDWQPTCKYSHQVRGHDLAIRDHSNPLLLLLLNIGVLTR